MFEKLKKLLDTEQEQSEIDYDVKKVVGKLKNLFETEQEQPEKDWYDDYFNLYCDLRIETDNQKKEGLFTQLYNFLMEKAENGDARAMNYLSRLYTDESYLPKEPEKAFYWDERSAKSGNKDGMYELGSDYLHGFGTKKDVRQAIYWYTEAAKHGDGSAYLRLAELYDDSGEIPADEEKALQYMQMYCKAEGDIDDPMYEFAENYAFNDDKRCNKWYEKSSKMGNSEASWSYGFYLLRGLTSKDLKVIIPKDHEKAKYYFERAALLGDTLGMCDLAQMYANGIGTEVDNDAADMWYQKAIENGSIWHLYVSGRDLFTGAEIFSKNIPMAAEFLIKALELKETDHEDVISHAKSMVILGCIYATEPEFQNALIVEKLTGVKQQNGIIDSKYQNIPMAEFLWNRTGGMGMPEGYFNLGVLYSRGDLVPPNHQLANEYFSKSDELCKQIESSGNGSKIKHMKNADKTRFIYP